MDLPAVLTVDQVATLMGCQADTVREHARSGAVPGLQWGRDWVFPAGALLRRLDELALEQAATRRDPPNPSGQLLPITGAANTPRGRARRAPPALPALSAAAPPDPRRADSRT